MNLYDWCLNNKMSILDEWDEEKNDISIKEISKGSNLVAYWICPKGHPFSAKINERTKQNGTGCPYCANQKVLKGYNDLASVYPELAKEYTEDNVTEADNIYCKSTKKVIWICEKGHTYSSRIIDRVRGNKCPYCACKKVLEGFNDLSSCYPDIASQWDYEKNNDCTPKTIVFGSTKNVWWKCKNGHSWSCKIEVRTRLKTGCPYCAGQRVISGHNDLLTKFPLIASEWDYELNKNITPSNVMAGSARKIHWICYKGHRYVASLNDRTSSGQGCPICATEQHTSFPEQAIFYYTSKYFNTINRYKDGKIELDIFIPELYIAVEYDGIYFHNSEESLAREKRKDNYCKKNKIELYHIKETIEKNNNSNNIIYRNLKDKEKGLNIVIKSILQIACNKANLLIDYDVDVIRDRNDIWSNYIITEKENSIEYLFPDIAKEWDYNKNGKLIPNQMTFGSHKKVFWICNKGHSYESAIKKRVNGNGCPYCANKKVLIGYNDLSSNKPDLAKEWDYTKNELIQPTDVTPSSGKKVYWICPKGHSYQASIVKRNQGRGCPYCANKKVLIGYNDLATTNPEVLLDWDYEKNEITPQMITYGSQKKVNWKCHKCGNVWESTPYLRVYKNNECSKCK